MNFLEKYNKALVALVGTALTVLAPHYNATAGLQYITGALTVLGVFHFRNGTLTTLVDDAMGALEQLEPTIAPILPSLPGSVVSPSIPAIVPPKPPVNPTV